MDPNPSPTNPEQTEAQLTALLLGQLSAEEAAGVRQAMAGNPELAALYDRLSRTIALVTEAAAQPEAQLEEPETPLQLSSPRREQLLNTFKSAAPRRGKAVPQEAPWFIPMSLAAMLIVMLGAAALLPGVWTSRRATAAYSPQRALMGNDRSAALDSYSKADQSVASAGSPVKLADKTAEIAVGDGVNGAVNVPRLSTPESIESTALSAGKDANGATSPESRFDNDGALGTLFGRLGGGSRGAASEKRGEDGRIATAGGIDATTGAPLPGTTNWRFNVELAGSGQFGAPSEGQDKAAGSRSAPVLGDAPALGKAFRVPQPRPLQEAEQRPGALATQDRERPNSVPEQAKQEQPGVAFSPDGQQVVTALPAAPALRAPEPAAAAVRLKMEPQLLERYGLKPQQAAQATPSLDTLAKAGTLSAARGPDLNRLRESARGFYDAKSGAAAPADVLKEELKEQDLGLQRQDEARKVKASSPAPVPQPEVTTVENPFSTFSLNVTDVSFRLAAASLERGVMPDLATVRSEEFLNAFDYRDPEPAPSVPVAFAWERARSPFAQDRDLLRFSVKTAAQGRPAGRPLNLVLLLDRSGSMERADRVRIVEEALGVLGSQLRPEDKLSVITFARTARLWADGVAGSQAVQALGQAGSITPEGGTNLEAALALAYETALRHFLAGGVNRVVLLTDGAANLGDVNPAALQRNVEANRQQGVALDCFGVGWEGYDDDLLQVLSSHGDGRYAFLNTPEEAATGFAEQLAGALQVAAANVKVQVEFNPKRVGVYRQVGYAKHQLTQEQFRDNTVDAAEIGAAESGNALYVAQINAEGTGPIGTVRVRFQVPGTDQFREQEWTVPYTGAAAALEQSSPALRLAATAAAFSEWLVSSPYAGDATPERLLTLLRSVPEAYGSDPRPRKLEWMIRQAGTLAK